MTEGSPDPRAVARAVMRTIRAQAVQSNQLRVRQLSEALIVAQRGELGPPERQRALDVAHQLAGSAGTFGYQRVSELARQLEAFFRAAPEVDRTQVEAAARGLQVMQQDLSAPADEQQEIS